MTKKRFVLSFIVCSLSLMVSESAQCNPAAVGGPEHVRVLSLILIKSTLTAVNHGNITGNYTVLRELGSPKFKENYTAADLATSFTPLRSQKVDLSPVLLVTPHLIKPPEEDKMGRLHLEGYCGLVNQQRVNFHLVYRTLPHGWLIEHISIGIATNQQQVSLAR